LSSGRLIDVWNSDLRGDQQRVVDDERLGDPKGKLECLRPDAPEEAATHSAQNIHRHDAQTADGVAFVQIGRSERRTGENRNHGQSRTTQTLRKTRHLLNTRNR
jgi:hypothetical protein